MEGITLDSRLVLLGVEDTGKEQVLKRMSDRLLELGYVKDTFYDALLRREEEYPTGIPGQYITFAMPHTYPEHVNRPAICMALCEHAIPFASMEDRENILPCQIILMLAITDSKQHLDLLRRLMEVTQREELAMRLAHAQTPDEALSVFGLPTALPCSGDQEKEER